MVESSTLQIDAQNLTLRQLFTEFYTVPAFQREYVWTTEKHVECLLDDIWGEFYDETGRIQPNCQYFLGSIVVSRTEENTFDLIDGQQRMTTLYIILCVIRDILKPNGFDVTEIEAQIKFVSTNPSNYKKTNKYRVELQYDDSKGILKEIADGKIEEARNKDKRKQTQSMKRLIKAYDFIKEYITSKFNSDLERYNRFHIDMTDKIIMIRIITPSVSNALQVFETINDRGVGLNPMDLLKNRLFMNVDNENYGKLSKNWEKLVGILERCHENPLRFFRYYIMAKYDITSVVRKEEIYPWFVRNAEDIGLEKRPNEFLSEMEKYAQYYYNFLEGKDQTGNANNHLRNLKILCGAIRQPYVMLLAGSKLSEDIFDKLCSAIENLYFCYVITRTSPNMFEKNIVLWAQKIRSVETVEKYKKVMSETFEVEMQRISEEFRMQFERIEMGKMQTYRLRYVLAKLTQHIDVTARQNEASSSLYQYLGKTVEVEHIYPLNPRRGDKDSYDDIDRLEQCKNRIGNLVLLEKPLNGTISNKTFEEKLKGYCESSFILTESIARKPQVGENTSLNRAVQGLTQYKKWDADAIEKRSQNLTDLAMKVWNVPEVRQSK